MADGHGSAQIQVQANNLSGQLSHYARGTSLSVWLEKFELYCDLNTLEEAKKVQLLLPYCGDTSCLPVTPRTKTYVELTALLKAPYEPSSLKFCQRLMFQQRIQEPSESTYDYAQALRDLANDCSFRAELQNRLL